MLGDPRILAHIAQHRRLGTAKPLRAFSPLVVINQGHSTPFFCVHGAGGNVLNFRDIARHLGDAQTFYGLQAPGVDGGRALQSIEDMSDLYVRELLRVQPDGPFLLGGYSGGGVVAFDMAQRLRREGHEVSLLVLLDTFAAHITPALTSARNHWRWLLAEGPSYLGRRVVDKVSRRVGELSGRMRIRFYERHQHPLPYDIREMQMTRAFREASAAYRPQPYEGRVILYRASEVSLNFRHAGEMLGWDALTPNMEVVRVPGNHDNLVQEPHVHVMMDHLVEALRPWSQPKEPKGAVVSSTQTHVSPAQ